MYRIIIALVFVFSISNFASAQTLNQVDERGNKQGKWIKTYQNGNTRYEGQFRDNKPYGEFHYYYESGKLQAVSKFSDDGVICKSTSFFENGNPMAEGTYVNQEKDGTWLFYSDIDGKKVAQETYSKGKLFGRKITFYPETGEPAEITYYKDGVKEGLFQKYYTGGKLMVAAKYSNNQLDGEYTVYHESGQIEIHGYYSNGLQIGNWEYFDENGATISEDEYKEQNVPLDKFPEQE